MGAEVFMVEASGKTAEEAFRKAYDDACYWSGHGGYTGTIAEKDDFRSIGFPEDRERTEANVVEYANELLDNEDPRIDDKWGPAGCIKIEEGRYLFFGWASS